MRWAENKKLFAHTKFAGESSIQNEISKWRGSMKTTRKKWPF